MSLYPRIRYVVLLLAFLVAPAHAADWRFEGAPRVVALSDIHGAHDALTRTLARAGIINEELGWAGGDSHLVIVGDILDRGPDSRQSLDLLMRLESEAEAAGGRVHVLIGNHEAMVLTGDLRYVSREEYAAFAADETTEERAHWLEQHAAKRNGDGLDADEQLKEFNERYPPGYFAFRRAFAADGKYGRWLLSKPVMIVIDDTAFVHGGLSPMVAETGLDGINRLVADQVRGYVASVETLTEAGLLLPTDSYIMHERLVRDTLATLTADEPVIAAINAVKAFEQSETQALEGPLWYRGNVACSEIIEVGRIEQALDAVGAERVVIGHTPTVGRRVLQRLDGRVIEVDTGMLAAYYEGSGNALVIEGSDLAVIGEGGAEASKPEPHPRRVGLRQPGLDAADIEKLLATGEVTDQRQDSFGRRFMSVTDGTNKVDAEFFRRTKRDFFPNTAAYRLDVLLGLDMIPVAVKRDLGGEEGTLQFLPAGTTDESRRRETGRGGSAWCPLPLQWDAMMVFDALVHNEARVATSIRYSQNNWDLILAEHSRTFSTRKDRPNHLENVTLKISDGWVSALEAIDDDVLAEELGDVIDARRLKALGARRDNLLRLAAD